MVAAILRWRRPKMKFQVKISDFRPNFRSWFPVHAIYGICFYIFIIDAPLILKRRFSRLQQCQWFLHMCLKSGIKLHLNLKNKECAGWELNVSC